MSEVISKRLRESATRLCEVSKTLEELLETRAKRREHLSEDATLCTYREAVAIGITCSAVIDESRGLLGVIDDGGVCGDLKEGGIVGEGGEEGGRVVRNGFDSLGVILGVLMEEMVGVIGEVDKNWRRWFVWSIEMRRCYEKMCGHHKQLRAFYGIVHLVNKIIGSIGIEGVRKSLFVDVQDESLEPMKWRRAVTIDGFYGRCFGFHYTPEMRNVLRICNIARGSVDKAVGMAPGGNGSLTRNVAVLVWGMFYSNMTIMNHLGVPVEGAEIGSDNGRKEATVDQVRTFMNLIEDPLIAGFTGLATKDVAIDKTFEIPAYSSSKSTDGLAQVLSSSSNLEIDEVLLNGNDNSDENGQCLEHGHNAKKAHDYLTAEGRRARKIAKRKLIFKASGPIKARLVSYKMRPVRLENSSDPVLSGERREMQEKIVAARSDILFKKESSNTMENGSAPDKAKGKAEVNASTENGTAPNELLVENKAIVTAENGVSPSNATKKISKASAKGNQVGKDSGDVDVEVNTIVGLVESEKVVSQQEGTSEENGAVQVDVAVAKPVKKAVIRKRRTNGNAFADVIAGAAEQSLLAKSIKSGLEELGSNLSIYFGLKSAEPAKGLILHFHGGGFISQSSMSHSVYTKEWAADMKDAVVLSIDYSLAPESKYPVALEECFYAYHWALENCTSLGTKAERVVLTGDSAGGNLAVAVALKAQAWGLRRPDGICVAYPALYMTMSWSPSRLLSFFDPLLPLSVLYLCLRSYIPEGADPSTDPYISPLVAPDDALRALPPITLVVGSFDPLMDDAVVFAHRMRRVGRRDVKLKIFESMPHGFLNMCHVSPQSKQAMSFISKSIATYLDVEKQN